MKPISWIARGFSYLFILYALYTGWVFYFSNGQSTQPFQFRGFSNHNGVLALIVGGAALAIWVARKIFIEMMKRQVPNFELTKQAILFFRKNHIVFGWATLITVTAHGVYYLFVSTNRQWEVYTGWISWGALCALTLLGIFFDKRLADRKNIKGIKIYHIGFALVFAVGVGLHLL